MSVLMDQITYYLGNPDAVLYSVATVLLYPVLFGQVLALVATLFAFGRFTVEVTTRKRASSADIEQSASEARGLVAEGKMTDARALLTSIRLTPLTRRLVEAITAEEQPLTRARAAKQLAEIELEATRRLEQTRVLVRFGPILGLMGTLIPISPALVALASGDVKTLADNLVVAFSATTVGLLVGGLAYTMTTVRDRLYAQDVSDIEYLLDELELR